MQQSFLGETRPVSQLPATQTPVTAVRENPFMVALNPESKAFSQIYGQNKPLEKPMFFGYRNNKALYVGSRLFVLY